MLVRYSAALMVACLAALPVCAAGGLSDARVREIAAMLPAGPVALGPPISDRAAWQRLAQDPNSAMVIRRAEALLEAPIPLLTDELYLGYSRTGERGRWESAASRRRGRIGPLVRAECLEDRGRFLPALEELVRALCAERTWVMPPHDAGLTDFYGREVNIDLGASDLAWQLASADCLLGERLSPQVRDLIHENVRRRALAPYLAMVNGERPPAWWTGATNNWNAVCLAGVTGAALAQPGPLEERALIVASAERYVRNYLAGFTEDGYCGEGLSYWNYGFGHFVMLAEEVRQATGGRVDLMELQKVRAAATFGPRMEIVSGVYPAFADCPLGTQPDARLLYFLNRRLALSLEDYADCGPIPPDGQLPEALMYSFPNSASRAPAPAPGEGPGIRSWFADAVALVCRPAAGTHGGFGVAILGGNNGESHNHDDVGTYVVAVGSQAVLLDPGREVYTARTFSPQRYESAVLNSFGHPVPVVAGRLQRTGRAAQARVLSTDFTDAQDTLVLDLSSAYDAPSLTGLRRTFSYSRADAGTLTVTDEVTFDSPQTFGTALITMGRWEQLGPGALRISDGGAAVRVDVDSHGAVVSLHVEDLKEDLPSGWTPTRIGIDLNQPVTEGAICLTITPEAGAPSHDNGG